MPSLTTPILAPAAPHDAADMAHIHRTARAAAMPWLPVLHTPEADLRFIANKVLPFADVTVARTAGAIAGFIATTPGWVDHLYIAPAQWRSGLGSALLRHAQSRQTALTLWTFAANAPARAFYAAHGFIEAEATDGAGNAEKTPDVRLNWAAASSA